LEDNDYRKSSPRFVGENFDKNYHLVQELNKIAQVKSCTAAQLALAWVMAKSPRIIPIPGTKRRRYLEENIEATTVSLSNNELEQLDHLFAPQAIAGDRYQQAVMKTLDK
jgi:aryl-alcohol dehydrogenase-like predicted oxidoreductase